jgi:guanylate kinase
MTVSSKKAIVVSAPSGAGKTTLVRHLLSALPVLEFSVSAASRIKREGEIDGRDYYFISSHEFRQKIREDEFVEWQEVYTGSFYGTLKSELERIWEQGRFPIFDVDVVGGLNLKTYFGDAALAIFISPPGVETLEKRLRHRGTENEDSLKIRLDKAVYEMEFAPRFDRTIVNDDLEAKCIEIVAIVKDFLQQ